MGKRQFLEILGERLSDELPRSLVINHLQYYESYINTAIQSGKRESEVMGELGDPIMIAHTIINTESGESFQGYVEDAEFTEIPKENNQEQYSSGEPHVEYTHVDTEDYSGQSGKPVTEEKKSFNTGCLIAAVVMILVVIGVVSLVGSIVAALIPILLPVLLILLVITLVLGKKK